MDIKNLVRKEVLNQEAYCASSVPCRIRLDANENPYTLSASQKSKIIESLEKVPLNRYPEPGSPELRRGFAGLYGVDEDMLIVGNGSDELIQLLLIAVKGGASGVMIPVPTFAMYKISALNTGHRVIEVPLDDRFDLDVDSMLEIIKNRSPELVFLSYPNNPTGNCFNPGKIEAVIRASSGIVVVDEAYFNFAGRTFLPYLDKYDNLAVLKSLSKAGLAAMRIGIFIGCPLLAKELNKVRLPYNLNAFSQIIARFYVENEADFQKQADKVAGKREDLFRGLSKIDGIRPYPSDANFILFNCSFDTGSVYKGLIKREILIRKFNAPGILGSCMRVTVGNCKENDEFLEALRDVVAGERARKGLE